MKVSYGFNATESCRTDYQIDGEKKLRSYIGKDCKLMQGLYKINSFFAIGMINKVMAANGH